MEIWRVFQVLRLKVIDDNINWGAFKFIQFQYNKALNKVFFPKQYKAGTTIIYVSGFKGNEHIKKNIKHLSRVAKNVNQMKYYRNKILSFK